MAGRRQHQPVFAWAEKQFSAGSSAGSDAYTRSGRRVTEDVVMRRYAGLVWKTAHRYYAHGHGIEDLAQEGFVGLIQAARDYQPEQGSFVAFAGMCIERRILDTVKQSRRGKHLILTDAIRVAYDEDDGIMVASVSLAPDRRPEPPELAEQRDTLRTVARTLAALTPLERRCLIGLASGDTYEQIGEPFKTIDNALQRARRKLKDAA